MQANYATQSATFGVQADEVRTEDLRGREHVVAPTTMVREMVLKGEFLPFEEIEATQLAWNAKPGTITHPTNESGDFLPASAPSQFESHVTARLFGVETSSPSRSLDGEIWIDRERAAQVADALDRDDPAEMLLDGETVEVSVGYWYERFEADGEHDGEAFDAVQVGIQPDHLALLPNAEGECSVADGCGAGRDDAAGAAMRAPASLLQRAGKYVGLDFGAACGECGGDCDAHDGESTGNDDSGHDTPDGHMTERHEHLAEQSAFDAETLRDWDEAQFDALEESLDDASTDGGDDNGGADGGDPPADDLADQVADQVLDSVNDRLDERLEQFEREQHEDERQALISQIAAQTGDDPDDYADWDREQLERFAENIDSAGGVYAGRAGTRGADGTEFDDVEPVGVTQAFEGDD